MKRDSHDEQASARRLAAACLMICGIGNPSVAWAADPLKPLVDCRTIADATARLACYDKEVDSLKRSVDLKEVTIVDKEQIKETRRGLFGFNIGKLPLFGKKDGAKDGEDQEDDILVATITSVRGLPYGFWRFTIEGGAVWETTAASSSARDPAAGMSVELKKAALGSYFVKINGGRAVRAKRVN